MPKQNEAVSLKSQMQMEEFDNNERKEEIFSRAVRAGKRTYFFDVKATKSDEYYLTITESKKRFNNESGKFFYEKHKLFLYKEDFLKFADGLNDSVSFIETGVIPPDRFYEQPEISDRYNAGVSEEASADPKAEPEL
ncbi:MAG: DUF3276 family protein [Bacteroidales bacterium]